ncbi:MAG TPA: hypothetical protein VMB80_13790 [Candidatus Acidoferrum sp.]|nr:hypothetical protein [Candidatus Acidoferrum sp.]
MKSSKTVRSRVTVPNQRFLIRTLLIGFFACDRQARAQDIFAPPPSAPDQTPAAVQQVNEMDVFAAPPETESQPFKWGAFTLRPHPYYQFLYADGIQANTNQVANTAIQTIAPGALLEMGQHWTLDYTPTFSIYSNRQFSDAFGQTARLVGGTIYNDWVLGLTQGYSETDTASATTGTQTREQTFATSLGGSYTVNSKMSMDLGADQRIVSADQFSSYREWSTMDWFNYQFLPRLNTAVGVGGGYDDNQSGPDATFEQAQGRFNWRASNRISFQIHGGVEIRQFLSGSGNDLVNPIFDATIQYQPLELTRISVTGQRTVSASYLQSQVTETIEVSVDVNQRLLRQYFLDLNGGYQNVKYVSSVSTSTPSRRDDYYFLNVQLGRTFLRRGTIAILYRFSQDNSSEAGYNFTTHQVGFQIGYSY